MNNTYIYFIQSLNGGNIKIGRSIEPFIRLATLQREYNDSSLRIIGLTTGRFTKENELHRQFAQFRKTGEWFEPSSEIFDYIKKNTTTDFLELDIVQPGSNIIRELLGSTSPRTIALMTGISHETIYKICREDIIPRGVKLETLDKVADCYGYRVVVTFEPKG